MHWPKEPSLHDLVMDRCGWPQIPFDGKLLISQQDALLMGGSVQAPPGYANHVIFVRPEFCQDCEPKLCVEMCSGQAITRGENSVPGVRSGEMRLLRRVSVELPPSRENVEFRAGAGGLHSALN